MRIIYIFVLLYIFKPSCTEKIHNGPLRIDRHNGNSNEYCGPFQFFSCINLRRNARVIKRSDYRLPLYLVPPPPSFQNSHRVYRNTNFQLRFPRLVQNSFSNLPHHQNGVSTIQSANNLINLRTNTIKSSHSSNYDQCSHPFHSWLCQTARPKITTTPKPRRGSILFSDPLTTAKPKGKALNSDTSNQNAIPFPNKRLEKPTTVIPTTSYDICNHPFHSWQCRKVKSTTARPKGFNDNFPDSSNIRKGSELFGEPVSTTPSTSTTKIPLSTTTYNSCNHPFHSWLCQQPTTTPKIFTGKPSGKQLFNEPVKIRKGSELFGEPITTTVRSTTIQTSTEYDICSHPFHSWLCSKPRPRQKALNKETLPSNTILKNVKPKSGSEQNSDPLSTTTTQKPDAKGDCDTSNQCTTTRMPKNIRTGSELFGNAITTPRKAPVTTQKPPDTSNYHKCNHAFHRWLCAKNEKRTGSEIFSEPRRQPQGANTFPEILIPTPAPTSRKPPTTIQIPSTTTIKPKSCNNHTLNSKGCTPESPRTGNILDATLNTGKNLLPLNKTQAWEKTDPCNHAFHSWLCKPNKTKMINSNANTIGKSLFDIPATRSTSTPVSTTKAVTTTTQPPTTSIIRSGSLLDSETLTTPKQMENNLEDLCRDPVYAFLCQGNFPEPITTTTIKPTTKKYSKSLQSNATSNSESIPEKCFHPFHAWLCNYYRTETKTQIPFRSQNLLHDIGSIPDIRQLPLESERTSETKQLSESRSPFTQNIDTSTSSNFKVINDDLTDNQFQVDYANYANSFNYNNYRYKRRQNSGNVNNVFKSKPILNQKQEYDHDQTSNIKENTSNQGYFLVLQNNKLLPLNSYSSLYFLRPTRIR